MPKPIQKRIEYAPQDRLSSVEHLAPRFFAEVVQRDYGEFMITDESDLFDILDEAGVNKALDRMDEHYLVNSRSCDSTRIVELLELLHGRGVSA